MRRPSSARCSHHEERDDVSATHIVSPRSIALGHFLFDNIEEGILTHDLNYLPYQEEEHQQRQHQQGHFKRQFSKSSNPLSFLVPLLFIASVAGLFLIIPLLPPILMIALAIIWCVLFVSTIISYPMKRDQSGESCG